MIISFLDDGTCELLLTLHIYRSSWITISLEDEIHVIYDIFPAIPCIHPNFLVLREEKATSRSESIGRIIFESFPV